MTYAYLRVSTIDQNNDKFRSQILEYANSQHLGHVDFVTEKISGKKNWKNRKLGELILSTCHAGDAIITPELSRLTRSIGQVYEIVQVCQEKKITLHIIKQNIIVSPKEMDISTKALISAFALVAEMERDFISARTTEALAAAKAAGKKLGRPEGSYRSRLDPYRDEILRLYTEGVPAARIAKKYGVTPQTIRNWLGHNIQHD